MPAIDTGQGTAEFLRGSCFVRRCCSWMSSWPGEGLEEVALHLTNDLHGIWGAPEITGKPVRADLRARKKSLPVVAALNSDAPEAAGLRALLTKPEPLTEEDLVRAADLVVAAGGRGWTESECETQLAAANANLADVDLADDGRAQFMAIAEFITGRRETPPAALAQRPG